MFVVINNYQTDTKIENQINTLNETQISITVSIMHDNKSLETAKEFIDKVEALCASERKKWIDERHKVQDEMKSIIRKKESDKQ